MLPSRQCDVGNIRSQSALIRTLARVENEGYREVSSGLEASRRASQKWIVVRKVVGGSATREAAAAVAMNTSEDRGARQVGSLASGVDLLSSRVWDSVWIPVAGLK